MTLSGMTEVEGAAAYGVSHLLDSRRYQGDLQYLVDWEAHGPVERIWVPAKEVLSQELRDDFHRSRPSHPAPRPWGCPLRTPRSVERPGCHGHPCATLRVVGVAHRLSLEASAVGGIRSRLGHFNYLCNGVPFT